MSKVPPRARPRRFRLWAYRLLLTPVAVLFLGNIIGATSFGTGFVEGEIEKRFHLDCRIGRLEWTPWSGGVVHQLELRSTEDSPSFVGIGKVTLDPSWSSLFQGGERFDSLTIQDAVLDLTLEEIQAILANRKVQSVQSPPEFAEVKLLKGNDEKKERVLEPQLNKTPRNEKIEPLTVETPRIERVPFDDFEGKIILKNMNLRLSSDARPELAVILGKIEGEIPVWGAARHGKIVFNEIQIGNDGNVEKLDLPIRWNNQSIEVTESEIHLFGIHLSVSASLRLARGLPLGVALNIPEQRIDFTTMGEGAPPLDLYSFRSQNNLQGYLLHPSLIYGVSENHFGVSELIDEKDGSRVRFERGYAEFTLNSSGLYSNDFHAIGEEESILGNGYLSLRGQGAATVRIVASPERADGYEKRVRALSPDWSLAFRPLVTPDRLYRDLRIDLQKDGLYANLSQEGAAVSFRDLLIKLREGRQPLRSPEIP